RRLPAQPLQRLDRLAEPALRLEGPRPPEPGLRRQHRVLFVGGLDDLAVSVSRYGGVAVLQLQLGVPQAELGVDALTGLDAVEEELGGAAEPLGQQPGDDGSRRTLTRLNE